MLSLQLFAPAIALPRAAVHSRSPPVRMVTSLEPPPTAMRKPLTGAPPRNSPRNSAAVL